MNSIDCKHAAILTHYSLISQRGDTMEIPEEEAML